MPSQPQKSIARPVEKGSQGSAPAGAGSNRQPRILKPGARIKSPEGSTETPDDRLQRLMDAGIVERPPPPEVPKSKFDKFADQFASSTKDAEGKFHPAVMRYEMNFGSWKALKPPKNVRYLEDFSYGISALYSLDRPSLEDDIESEVISVGPAVLFYNGGAFATLTDVYGTQSPVYADYNATELGAEAMLSREKLLGRNFVSSVEFKVQVLPFRWVRGHYQSIKNIPRKSEANSHFRGSTGLGASFGWSASFVKAIGIGLFASVHHALPSQVKARFGMTLYMLQSSPPAVVASDRSPSDTKSEALPIPTVLPDTKK